MGWSMGAETMVARAETTDVNAATIMIERNSGRAGGRPRPSGMAPFWWRTTTCRTAWKVIPLPFRPGALGPKIVGWAACRALATGGNACGPSVRAACFSYSSTICVFSLAVQHRRPPLPRHADASPARERSSLRFRLRPRASVKWVSLSTSADARAAALAASLAALSRCLSAFRFAWAGARSLRLRAASGFLE